MYYYERNNCLKVSCSWLCKIENLVFEGLTNITFSSHSDKIENRYVERKNFDWNFPLSRNFWRARRNRLQLVDKVVRQKNRVKRSLLIHTINGILGKSKPERFLKFSIFFTICRLDKPATSTPTEVLCFQRAAIWIRNLHNHES